MLYEPCSDITPPCTQDAQRISWFLELATGCPCGYHPVVNEYAWWHAAAEFMNSGFRVVPEKDTVDWTPVDIPEVFDSAWEVARQFGALGEDNDLKEDWYLFCVLPDGRGVVLDTFRTTKSKKIPRDSQMYILHESIYGIAAALAIFEDENSPAPLEDPALTVSQDIRPFLIAQTNS